MIIIYYWDWDMKEKDDIARKHEKQPCGKGINFYSLK